MTSPSLCMYYLGVWSNFNFLDSSQWITFPTQSCFQFFKSFRNFLQDSFKNTNNDGYNYHHVLFFFLFFFFLQFYVVIICNNNVSFFFLLTVPGSDHLVWIVCPLEFQILFQFHSVDDWNDVHYLNSLFFGNNYEIWSSGLNWVIPVNLKIQKNFTFLLSLVDSGLWRYFWLLKIPLLCYE